MSAADELPSGVAETYGVQNPPFVDVVEEVAQKEQVERIVACMRETAWTQSTVPALSRAAGLPESWNARTIGGIVARPDSGNAVSSASVRSPPNVERPVRQEPDVDHSQGDVVERGEGDARLRRATVTPWGLLYTRVKF